MRATKKKYTKKQRYCSQRPWLAVGVLCSVLAVGYWRLRVSPFASRGESTLTAPLTEPHTSLVNPVSTNTPTATPKAEVFDRREHEFLNGMHKLLGDIEFVYQQPPTCSTAVGVLFLAHGCSHSAMDAWPQGPECPDCIGLPVETSIVANALTNCWVTLSVTSQDRETKCWGARDVPRVYAAVKAVQKLSGMSDSTPVAAIGASSGGAFVSKLKKDKQGLNMVGVVIQIMQSTAELTPQHLPVRFVHMRLDTRTSTIVSEQVATLISLGVDAAGLLVESEAITVETFMREGGVPALSLVQARAAVAALVTIVCMHVCVYAWQMYSMYSTNACVICICCM